MKIFEPNFGIVELCVTYRCNVKCANCSNLCTQAPKNDGDLTPEDVRRFLDDSIEHNHKWGMITIHGGEPVLNPQIDEICRILASYKHAQNPGCVLWLLTNNSSPEVKRRVTEMHTKYNIPLGISTKKGTNADGKGNPIEYVPVNISAKDLGIDYDKGCFQTSNCGVCYNYMGYFGCSPMAAAARVFGYEPVARSIKNFTRDKIMEAFNMHCGHCGFSIPGLKRDVCQCTTSTWETMLGEYNAQWICLSDGRSTSPIL